MDIKTQDVKAIVKAIRNELKANPKHTHNSILAALASGLGFKSWEALQTKLEGKASSAETSKDETPEALASLNLASYYSFGKIKEGDSVNAFNARTLSPIIGTLDNVPGCAMLDGFTYSKKLEEIEIDYSGDTEMYWNDQVTQHNSAGMKWYIDQNELRVPANQIVFAPEKYCSANSLETLPVRCELLHEYWKAVVFFKDPVAFLALSEEQKLEIILGKLEPHVGLKLTQNEISSMLNNQVYGDMLIDYWFGIEKNPRSDSIDNRMYETYGEDLKAVKAMNETDPSRVWTYLECDGVWVIASGYHHVNRMGYFLTEKGLPENVSSVEFLDELHGTYSDDEDSEDEDVDNNDE